MSKPTVRIDDRLEPLLPVLTTPQALNEMLNAGLLDYGEYSTLYDLMFNHRDDMELVFPYHNGRTVY